MSSVLTVHVLFSQLIPTNKLSSFCKPFLLVSECMSLCTTFLPSSGGFERVPQDGQDFTGYS